MTRAKKLTWINDGDRNYESACGRSGISRRYQSVFGGGVHGWAVDVIEVGGDDDETDAYFCGYCGDAKRWAEEHSKSSNSPRTNNTENK